MCSVGTLSENIIIIDFQFSNHTHTHVAELREWPGDCMKNAAFSMGKRQEVSLVLLRQHHGRDTTSSSKV